MNLSTFNSRKLPKAFLTALCLFLLTVGGATCYLIKTDAVPAPMITRRYSLDEKMRFMRMNKSYDADIIVIGSSTGLNNLSSEAVSTYLDNKMSYFNYSIGLIGTPMVLDYWKVIDKIADPKIVIIATDLFGYQKYKAESALVFNETDFFDYINGGLPIWYYFKYHQAGFIGRVKNVGPRRKPNNDRASIRFDRGGGIMLNVPENKIEKTTWRDEVKPSTFHKSGYEALNELLTTLNEKGIISIIVQGALREHYLDTDTEYAFVKRHWEKVESIAQKHGTFFFNMQKTFSTEENYFADSLHLNQEGAEIFTRKLLERMKEEGIFQKVNDNIVYRE